MIDQYVFFALGVLIAFGVGVSVGSRAETESGEYMVKMLGSAQFVDLVEDEIETVEQTAPWRLVSTYTTKILGDDVVYGVFRRK